MSCVDTCERSDSFDGWFVALVRNCINIDSRTYQGHTASFRGSPDLTPYFKLRLHLDIGSVVGVHVCAS